MRKLRAFLALLVTLVMVGCELPADPAAVRGEIQVLVKQFADAAQKDVNAMLAMYEQGPGTSSVGNGQVERGIEGIRKHADMNLVGTQGKFKVDLGSIEVTSIGVGYAMSVTPFVITENPTVAFSRQMKGVDTLVWKKTSEGWKIIHEHESYQP